MDLLNLFSIDSIYSFLSSQEPRSIAGKAIELLVIWGLGNKLINEKNENIKKEVDQKISKLLNEEVRNVKNTLAKERIISETVVDYYLPSTDSEPNEYKLLNERGFVYPVNFYNEKKLPEQKLGCVFIIDLVNINIYFTDKDNQSILKLESEKEQNNERQKIENAKKNKILSSMIFELSDKFAEVKDRKTAFVVYVKGRVDIEQFKDLYIIASNSLISLIGNVADAAYTVYGERNK